MNPVLSYSFGSVTLEKVLSVSEPQFLFFPPLSNMKEMALNSVVSNMHKPMQFRCFAYHVL